MVPGECHPDYEDIAHIIRSLVFFRHELRFGGESGRDNQVQLRRQKMWQSFYPEYGAYMWYVWVDEDGRGVADEEAVWVENPDAFLRPVFNPNPAQPNPTMRWLEEFKKEVRSERKNRE